MTLIGASLIAQLVKNLPAMQKTPVQFLGQEDPPENEMATHSSTLAWRIPWKAMMNLDSASLPAKVCIVKAMVFPVVMYGCESWTIKKAKR